MIIIRAKRNSNFFTTLGTTEEINTILRAIRYLGTHHINSIPLVYRDTVKRTSEAIPNEILQYEDEGE